MQAILFHLKKFLNSNLFNLTLIFIALLYYLPFVNKGLILNDPGYYLYNAERILEGNIPYSDFFLQFPPGYFYLLATAFKVFGASVLTGRYITLAICLGIVFITLKILELMKLGSKKMKLISILCIISFGFPLINSPALLAWISVLFSLFIVYSYIKVIENRSRDIWLVLLGLFLSGMFLVKQNLAIYFFVAINMLLIIPLRGSLRKKINDLLKVNLIVVSVTLFWVLLFFVGQDIRLLHELIAYNRRYLEFFVFSYPFISVALSQFGVFKIIPYYLPIVFLGFVIKRVILEKKKVSWQKVTFAGIPIIGFFGTVFPTSDLLHVYPFFGVMLVSILAFFHKEKSFYLWLGVVIVSILIGFYLTHFREYYRYDLPYSYQNTKLSPPRAQGILVDKNLASSINSTYKFLRENTSREDTVLMYPFCETLYFIFNRESPSRFSIYLYGLRTEAEERRVISKLKSKKTKYVVTCGEYRFNSVLSKYIQNLKLVRDYNSLKIFLHNY